uniref:Protein ripply3 n=1 Tax=Otus sunia TaxID=257818 RepID=A0A8C8B8Y0_9STRI
MISVENNVNFEVNLSWCTPPPPPRDTKSTKLNLCFNIQANLAGKESHSFTFSLKICFLIRLYLPKSKSQKFLNNIGEKVLASFPVQATIHFYNDDADSEEDEEIKEILSCFERLLNKILNIMDYEH